MPAAGGVTSCVPAVAVVPLHAPLASQVEALETDQVRVAEVNTTPDTIAGSPRHYWTARGT